MYSEFNSIHNARYVFDKTLNKTIFVWNAFIRALALAGHGEEALEIYRQMNETRIPSDRFTYPYILKACVGSSTSASLLRKGKEIHAHILRHGFESYVHVATTLVDMYARYGCVSSAGYVFDFMPERNVVSWSAMIACYAKNGRPFEALMLFQEMMAGNPDDVPNSVTMVSVLQACAALAALGQGKLMHGYILRRGLDSILPVINSLITMYAKCGSVEIGRRVFDRMIKRDVVSWNSMISGYGIHGFGEEAVRVFKEMIYSGISPNTVTFVSVLGACCHVGLVDEGKKLFDSMVRQHNIFPSAEHHACMVDLLGRAGQLEEAVKMVEDMRIEPGPTVWGSLLGSCRIHCNIELAERACRRLFELEPMNAGNYVLLAGIYAEAKMWEEVSRVRKLLEARGLQKLPGCSWIEVKKKIYSFMSVDELNPQMEQLHALLAQLSMEMKETGYVPDTKVVLYELDQDEKERIILGHSEKLALAFGLINCSKGETIRITKNLRLCEDCHSVTKFISKFANREILVRDVNRFHHFRDGVCSCGDYW
ncbi:Pentatricopeptide repeat [Macleaya cordata]|uniref:Pentatricopeptide repeat n=1 Tax=Macleaya cordata TaxID=56857 RepID=A0A200R4W8_MACCD|nr:Pentatricopeptide repeat [Macleaya cordata]